MHAVFRRSLTRATLPVLASAGLLLLPGTALAEEATVTDTAATTTAATDADTADATATSACVAPADLGPGMLRHTFDAAVGTGTVTYRGTEPLCEPFVVRATTWRFQDGVTPWPQDLIGFNDTSFTEPGTYPYATPTRDCGQLDIYAGWSSNADVEAGEGLAVPDVIEGPNTPYEPRFLHEYSAGPNPTYDVSDATCVPDAEVPDAEVPDTEVPGDGDEDDEDGPETDGDDECVDAVDDPDCEAVLPGAPIDQDGSTPPDGDTPTDGATPVDTNPTVLDPAVTEDVPIRDVPIRDVPTSDAVVEVPREGDLPRTGVFVPAAVAGGSIAMGLGAWLLRRRPTLTTSTTN